MNLILNPEGKSRRRGQTGADVAQLALNAAAMQTLLMKQAGGGSLHVHHGKLIYGKAPLLLDGHKSKDVSYIADSPGHGGNAPISTSPRQRRPSRKVSPPHESHGSDPELSRADARAEVNPSSRAEAVAAADVLRRQLSAHDAKKVELEVELPMWNAAFAEVVRQVHVHCNERGQLLEAIRARYNEVLDKLVTERATQMSKFASEGKERSEAEIEAARKRARQAMLFARGVSHAQKITLEAELSAQASPRPHPDAKPHPHPGPSPKPSPKPWP